MIRDLFHKILKKHGKRYTIDEQIPDKLLVRFIKSRIIMLIRGLMKTRKKIFIGKQVSIINVKNFSFGNSCTIESHVSIDCFATKAINFGDVVKIGQYSKISTTSHLSKLGKGLEIGNNFAIGEFSYFGCSGGIKIGNDVIMGQYVSFHSENHLFSDSNTPIREQGVTSMGINLGNNIWVGSKVTFLDGSTVGDNCVIAAGAIVKDKFPSNSLIAGVPAKVIKKIYE